MAILNVHNALGGLLVLASIGAIFWAPARRYVLYLLVLQIVIGSAVWGITKLVPSPLHYGLAILNGGTYAMATVLDKRGRPARAVQAVLVLGAVVFVVVYSIGLHTYKSYTGAS